MMTDTNNQNTAEELPNVDDTEAQLLMAMSLNNQDEIPVYRANAGKSLKQGSKLASVQDIVEALKTVFDPEIPINIYDLGLIYNINQQPDGDIHIDMTLTAPGCPVAGILPQQVADAAAGVAGVGKVEVEIVWEPAWSIERLSEEAKMMLEMF